MSSISSFNDMMGQFLDELALTFPEDEGIYSYKMQFKIARNTDPRAALETYMMSVKPYAEKMMAKDPTFFTDDAPKINFLSNMNIPGLWASPDVSDATRAAVWQYMQTLYILGTTITMFPPETLSMIENAAEQCAEKMQNTGTFDMSAMSSLFSSIMGGGSPLAMQRSSAPTPPGAPKKKNPRKK